MLRIDSRGQEKAGILIRKPIRGYRKLALRFTENREGCRISMSEKEAQEFSLGVINMSSLIRRWRCCGSESGTTGREESAGGWC